MDSERNFDPFGLVESPGGRFQTRFGDFSDFFLIFLRVFWGPGGIPLDPGAQFRSILTCREPGRTMLDPFRTIFGFLRTTFGFSKFSL